MYFKTKALFRNCPCLGFQQGDEVIFSHQLIILSANSPSLTRHRRIRNSLHRTNLHKNVPGGRSNTTSTTAVTYWVEIDIGEQPLDKPSNVNFELVQTKDVDNFTIETQILEPMGEFFLYPENKNRDILKKTSTLSTSA